MVLLSVSIIFETKITKLKYFPSVLCLYFVPALYGNEATIVKSSQIIGCFYIKFEILKESLLLAEKYISDISTFPKMTLDTERIITWKRGSTED